MGGRKKGSKVTQGGNCSVQERNSKERQVKVKVIHVDYGIQDVTEKKKREG